MKRNTLLIFSIAALTFSACGDDDRPMTTTDGGGDSGTPDSTINTPDGSTEDDASTVDNRTRECGMITPSLRTFWDEPRCAQATQECISACEDTACITACIQADETPARTEAGLTIDCGFCLSYEPFVCLYNNGCDTEIADFACCANDKCSGLTGEAAQQCSSSMCASEGQAQNTCIAANRASCTSALDSCYPTGSDADGGTGDAGTDAAVDAGADAGA